MLHNKRKIILALVIICLIGLLGLGISYAYWKFTYMQTDNNIAISKCLKLDITNEKNEINLTNMYPISDEEGKKLTPYSFKITNTCSMSAEYKVNLEMLEGTTLNSKYLASLVNNENIKLLSSYDTTKTTISGSVESRTLDTSVLTPGASKEYSISLWMDKSVTLADDAQNKSFSAKVVIDASMYTGIVDKIVAQLDTTGKCPTVNENDPYNLAKAETENSLLCSALDNYGTSYYYRGNVQNNYVKFGKWSSVTEEVYYGYLNLEESEYKEYASLSDCKNAVSYNINCKLINRKNKDMYWRIVRINGDGSIRLIYDGTSTHANGEVSEDRQIGESVYNETYDDNAYVGYMYGKADSLTYEETHANINDSTIKKYIDAWYEINIKNTIYEKYLADNIFCVSRSTSNNSSGIGQNNTYYNFNKLTDKTLKCNNKNDSFTVNDKIVGINALKYPIGLLTYDESIFAGSADSTNSDFYLFTGKWYWVITPYSYSDKAYVRSVGAEGNGVHGGFVNYQYGKVKPVINLKPNSLKTGDGTINNPYVVE